MLRYAQHDIGRSLQVRAAIMGQEIDLIFVALVAVVANVAVVTIVALVSAM